jgi:putative ABC transport system substrate-binding protein
MRRRDLLVQAAGAVTLSPLAARAQSRPARRLGILLYTDPKSDPQMAPLLQGLHDLGYIDGRNVLLEYRSANGKPERLPELAAELVGTTPDVVVALGGDVAPFAAAATKTIPIVFSVSTDPVRAGLAGSFARPGGNATGVSFIQDELAAKRLELLKEAVPQTSAVGFLLNPEHVDNELPLAERAGQAIGVRIRPLEVRRIDELGAALQGALDGHANALYAVSSRLTVSSIPAIAEFALRNRLPLVGGWGAWAKAGALLSYGPNTDAMVRRAAGYIDKILKGESPSLLPIEQPTRFHLVLNMLTAETLGLTIPESIRARADEVIE